MAAPKHTINSHVKKFLPSIPTWLCALVWFLPLCKAETPIPVEDFAREPLFSQMKLSPDGEWVAFLRNYEDKPALFFTNPNAKAKSVPIHIDPGYDEIEGIREQVRSFEWVNATRVAFTITIWDDILAGVKAIDRDGKHSRAVTGGDASPYSEHPLFAYEIVHHFDDPQGNVLMLNRIEGGSERRLYPDVIEISTLTGRTHVVAKNPGNVTDWGIDHDGKVRLGWTEDNFRYGFIARDDEKSPWERLKFTAGKMGIIGYDYDNSSLYVSSLSPEKRWAIYRFNPDDDVLNEPLMADPVYDLTYETGYVPAVDGIPLCQLILSDSRRALVGIRYLTEGPKVRWFDPDYAAKQKRIDGTLPGTVNIITSRSKDENRMIVLALSDRDPGTYYLFDFTAGEVRRIAPRMAWIDPARMAPMYPVAYKARDDETIHGYLTLPPGRGRQGLPFIVMPHGGPYVRDVWGFDPLVQFLANRGYAVLQMNYRGSPGYGQSFFEKGRREIGRGIQDDIEDGARWAIAQGFADPRRLAIVGGSYGGFSALFALGHSPDLYRCGVSIAGVTDWLGIFKSRSDPEYKFAYHFWVEHVGDPKDDLDFLESISPVNFADRITAPVLIIQGRDDKTVPPRQAKKMISALEKAGRQPESYFASGEGHGFVGEKARIEEFKRIEDFLARNLGPGAPVQRPNG